MKYLSEIETCYLSQALTTERFCHHFLAQRSVKFSTAQLFSLSAKSFFGRMLIRSAMKNGFRSISKRLKQLCGSFEFVLHLFASFMISLTKIAFIIFFLGPHPFLYWEHRYCHTWSAGTFPTRGCEHRLIGIDMCCMLRKSIFLTALRVFRNNNSAHSIKNNKEKPRSAFSLFQRKDFPSTFLAKS